MHPHQTVQPDQTLLMQLSNIRDEFSNNIGRLEALANRTFGPGPEHGGVGQPAAIPPLTLPTILSELVDLTQRLDIISSRLETIA